MPSVTNGTAATNTTPLSNNNIRVRAASVALTSGCTDTAGLRCFKATAKGVIVGVAVGVAVATLVGLTSGCGAVTKRAVESMAVAVRVVIGVWVTAGNAPRVGMGDCTGRVDVIAGVTAMFVAVGFGESAVMVAAGVKGAIFTVIAITACASPAKL